MNIVHISAECYPAAKAGGLGDVVGALPKYLNRAGHKATVILPNYKTEWLKKAESDFIYEGEAPIGAGTFSFSVHRVKKSVLGFELYLIDIPGRFDRPGVYIDPWSGHAYWDEMERFFTFQIAALEWMQSIDQKPDVIHCHDHHTGLIPFMMKECFRFESFRDIPSVLTIHNGEYQGKYARENYALLPAFNLERVGMLDWNGTINCLAAGIKSAWQVTTVSEGYMQELLQHCHGLEFLLQQEEQKTLGIVNGIDVDVWNPQDDSYLHKNFTVKTIKSGKKANKKELCNEFNLNEKRPLFSFIGRLVLEKGADLIPDVIEKCHEEGVEASFLVLGTGDPELHTLFKKMESEYVGYFDSRLEYNEGLAHQIYAGSDFLMMPSRVEPCGLNQFYAMRYGTIPIVRKIGGLSDTVVDMEEKNGYGIVFEEFATEPFFKAIKRGVEIYGKKELFNKCRGNVMKLDFSWTSSTEKYIHLYKSIQPKKPVS
ncbi:MAG: glycogen synthase [Balneolaceae bacterium]